MESGVNNCEGNEPLPIVVDGEEIAIERVIKLEPNDDDEEIKIDFEAYGYQQESVFNDLDFEYLVKNEPEIDSNVEPRAEKVGVEFLACDENVITVSPQAVFMCQNLEREATNKRALQLHHRLDSEAEDDGDERIVSYEECFSPETPLKINKQKPNEIIFVDGSIEFDRKLQRGAIVVLERCAIPSSKLGEQKKIPESKKKPRIGRVSTETLKEKRKRPNETPEEREKRLVLKAESTRRRKANETPEQRDKRLELDAERKRQRRANVKGSSQNGAIDSAVRKRWKKRGEPVLSWAMKMKQRIATETPEERKIRLAIRAEKTRLQKAIETPEQRKARLAKDVERKRRIKVTKDAHLTENAAKRANETAEQIEANRAYNAERQRPVMTKQTPEQRENCLELDSERKKQRRAIEISPELRTASLAADLEGKNIKLENTEPPEICELDMSNSETGGRKKRRIHRKRSITNSELIRMWKTSETLLYREKRLKYVAETVRQKGVNEATEKRKEPQSHNAEKVKQNRTRKILQERVEPVLRNALKMSRSGVKETPEQETITNPQELVHIAPVSIRPVPIGLPVDCLVSFGLTSALKMSRSEVNETPEQREASLTPDVERNSKNGAIDSVVQETRKQLQERVEPRPSLAEDAGKMKLRSRNITLEQREASLTSDVEGSEAIESAVQKRRQKLKKRGEPASRIANETLEERKIRLAIRAEKTRLQKANETPEQRKARLAKDVERKRRKLVTKDPENAAKMRQKRANATPEQKEARLAKEIERRTQKRANETPEQRQARLAKDAERLRRKKTNATPEQIEAKRAYDAERQRRAMANQTPEQREKRLAVNAEKARRVLANKRASETPEQREARLAYYREVMRLRLANETPEQRTARRAADLVRKKQRIANETPEQREKRLAYATMRNSYYGERKRQKEARDGASVKNPEITRLPLEQCEDLLTTC